MLALCAQVKSDDDLGRELPRIKPLEPAAALASFRLQPGFRLEPVAVEPLVLDPVSACYDADGRLYVVEMRGYPYPEKVPTGQVVRLEDRDGDGRLDSSTNFVDRLSWPTGIAPYDGGVFIAVAPDIVYARDIDGDGVADVKKVMFTGFGTENVQGLFNGLLWGPDGWIYGVASSNGGEVRNLSRPEAKPVSVRGRDFRFKPDGSAFEAISGGGQFGHAFDDWGHRFTCSNSNHIRQIVLPAHDLERNPALTPPGVAADIAAEGAAAPVYRISEPEPWRVVRTRQRAADPEMKRQLPATELVATGFFTSATGVTIYRGSKYPEAFHGNAFVGDVGGNLVHRKTLSVQGSIYQARRADQHGEFLASTDNWFRPVNFANTPDGTLLILDMYRETIEHPWSIPEPIKKHLDLTSGKDRGRLYELIHENTPPSRRRPRLSQAATSDLVPLLADRDSWWRETAQRLLVERRDESAIPLLIALASRRPTDLGRLHALWTLDALDALKAHELFLGLRDPEARIREQAVRLAEPRLLGDAALSAVVFTIADDPDPMVRFQVALTLGDVRDRARALRSLAGIAVRDADDPWTRAAVLSAIPRQAAELLEILSRKADFLSSKPGRVWLDELALLSGAEREPASLRRLVETSTGEKNDLDASFRVLVSLDRGARRTGTSLVAEIGEGGSARLEPLWRKALDLAGSDAPVDRRTAAIAFLGIGGSAQAIDVLAGLLDARQPVPVQLEAIRALGILADPTVGARVVDRWKAMSPAVRREAVELLFGRRDRLESLVEALKSGHLAASEIDPDRVKSLRNHKDDGIRKLAISLLGAALTTKADRAKAIDALRPAIRLAGRPDKGRVLFQKTCATCHRAEGKGADVGPDLSTVAGRSPEDLMLHILDPNREVAPNYMNYSVATVDGRTISGIIVGESAAAVTLKRAEGVAEVVPRSQIEAITSTGLSLMPEGLEQGITPQDLADLIAFLKMIKG